MTPVLLPKHELHSPEWHEARRSRLGGSEIAAVLGLSPWTSPFSLWHLKAGLVEPDGDRPAMEWGRRLEPVVAAKFCDEHPEFVSSWYASAWAGYEGQGQAYAHPDRDWQAASPDLLLSRDEDWSKEDDGGRLLPVEPVTFCEVKTSARADAWYDGVPVYYRTQVLWTMDVLGVDHAYLAALIGGSDYREFVVEMDDDAQADLAVMRRAGEEFMASLAAGIPPDIDDSYGTYQTLRRLHPDIDLDTEVEISREMAEAYVAANYAEQEVKRQQQKARNDIARLMLRSQYAVCDGVRIARRQPSRDNGPAVLVSVRSAPRKAFLTHSEGAAA
jgi:putative phage-type endonuclease